MSETPTPATDTALELADSSKRQIKVDSHGLAFESAAEVYKIAQGFVSGGVCPKGMTPGGAMAAILKGRALGIDEVTAVTGITVINGRTQIQGSLLLAIMRRAGIDYDITHTGEGNTREANIRAWWPGRENRAKARSFSMGDAARAGLAGKDTYKAWPDDMLLWRAVAKLARQEFPEIGAGVYVPGEIPGDPETPPEELRQAEAPRPPALPDPLLDELGGAPFATHQEADAAIAAEESRE